MTAATFEEIRNGIAARTPGSKGGYSPEELGTTLRAVTGYVAAVSPTAKLSESERFCIVGFLHERVALVLGKPPERLERLSRLPMWHRAIDALFSDEPDVRARCRAFNDSPHLRHKEGV